jgi:LDH2 family malate/lactate/ureidoglycolate dehydrogenase
MSSIHIHQAPLSKFAAAIFQAQGMSATDAATVADVLVWANLRGADSHGVSRIPSYLDYIRSGALDPRARPAMRALTPSSFVLDCAHSAGPVAMMQAAATAREAVATSGICMGLVSATTHTGAIGRYAEWLAKRNCAAIVFVGGPPLMAYHGARTASLSTAPLAIAVPGPDEQPLLLDMASSIVAAGRLRDLAAAGKPVPEGWALDAEGKPPRDAGKATTVLPLGGPKGSGLSFMFECLTGIMAGTPVLTMLAQPTGSRRHAQNAVVIAINIETFRPLAEFRRDIAALAAQIKSLPRQEGYEDLLLPGERGGRNAETRRRAGIPIERPLWVKLCEIAEPLGITVPESVS